MGLGGAISGVRRAGCRAAGGLASFRHAAWPALRIFLGLVLLTAAGLKAYQLASEPVLGRGVLDSRWFLTGLVQFEIFSGLWLLSGLYPRASRLVAVGCFAAFAAVSLWKALSGESTCGCLGSRIVIHPWYTLGFDCVVLMALIALRVAPSGRSGWRGLAARARLAWAVAFASVLAVAPGLAVVSPEASSLDEAGQVIADGSVVVLEPEKWVGKRFPLLAYIDIGELLGSGEWIVLLSADRCSACRQAARHCSEVVRSVGLRTVGSRAALLELPAYSVGLPIWCRRAGLEYGRLSAGWRWVFKGPLFARLSEGVCVRIFGWPAEGPHFPSRNAPERGLKFHSGSRASQYGLGRGGRP